MASSRFHSIVWDASIAISVVETDEALALVELIKHVVVAL